MKQVWQKLATRIDALGLRERIFIFVMAVVVLVALVNATLLDPQFSKATELSKQITQDQSQITGIQAEIRDKIAAFNSNPDAAGMAQLALLKQKAAQMRAALQDMQKGVVSPDRMATLLEDILRQNGKLRLVSLHTIAPDGLNDANDKNTADTKIDLKADGRVEIKTDNKAVADKNANVKRSTGDSSQKAGKSLAGNVVYKHGFEIVIAGSYGDMVDYMAALEALPWQLFWGKAKLSADESSKLTLTLTLYTLSLDKSWLDI